MSQTPQQNAVMLMDYWRESRRPLVSLVFISPLLIVYEVGILLPGDTAMRNGADAWLRLFLHAIGFGQYFLLPALTVGVLLGWHHINRDPWQVPKWVLSGMAGECLSLALLLVVIAHLQAAVLGALTPFSIASGGVPEWWLTPTANFLTRFFSRAVSFCGAGIYEEVLFRLILLTGLTVLFHLAGASTQRASWVAVIVSSLLFSLAHYVGAEGDSFRIDSFVFRFIAGAFFAVLFVRRGFGITAGTHALYDIIVGLLL
jgi:membrane protease YdiL (CAAX protease family)